MILVAPALAALSASACMSSHTCPNIGASAVVAVPAAQSSPIVRVSTDPECTASTNGPGRVIVSRSTAGACQVFVELTNRDTYAFAVTFEAAGIINDCPTFRTVGSSEPELLHAGAGGPG